ncbi:SAM-dependent methyltransferase [Saccharothrix australiensis]|uniref:O-methyltransferase involved in polyketide biosynthesis n=1 Tax=Saccharothrix australiensis TaxID=2072 RepID=A0A495VUZ5_9PSEU|nr:SAM-dependent methyltransferase [Saccharothrix australiensis]RKT53004.1 O-methyltransferase involved in polyketide biosynthesis [Saccharothrix australiensis]
MSSPSYEPRSDVDLSVPSAARAYDYFLDGAHNFAVDRAFADQVLDIAPSVPAVAKLNRSFLRRVVKFCLDQGIRQFLDLGSGIPTVGNVHEIAQQVDPASRVVYVDYEPVAYAHARQLLSGNPFATIVQADIRDPGTILDHPETRRLIDFSEPVALLMVGVLLFISDEDRPGELVGRYRELLAPGSFLAISHIASEEAGPELQAEVARLVGAYAAADEHVYVRTREEILGWFDERTSLVEPGLVCLPDWRPDNPSEASSPARLLGYGGVARVD